MSSNGDVADASGNEVFGPANDGRGRFGRDARKADADGADVRAENVPAVQRVAGGDGRVEPLKVDETAALLCQLSC